MLYFVDENCGTEQLNNLSAVKQLVSCKDQTQIQGYLIQKSMCSLPR